MSTVNSPSPLLHNYKRGTNAQLWAVTEHRGHVHKTLAPLYPSQEAALRRAQNELTLAPPHFSFTVDNVSTGYHVARFSRDPQTGRISSTFNPAAFED